MVSLHCMRMAVCLPVCSPLRLHRDLIESRSLRHFHPVFSSVRVTRSSSAGRFTTTTGSSATPGRIASPRGLARAINIAVMMWSTSTGLPLVRSGTFAAQPPPLRVKLTQERSGFGIRGFLTRSTRLPEVRTKLGSQQHIHLHSDPSLASRRALTPLARMAGRLVSSGTLGFCFIFCFLFSYDGTFTRVFRPMQGSPPSGFQLFNFGILSDTLLDLPVMKHYPPPPSRHLSLV